MSLFTNASFAQVETFSLKEKGSTWKIRPNFTLYEFRCRSGGDIILVHPRAADLAQEIRTQIGMPVSLESAYREWLWHVQIYEDINAGREAQGLDLILVPRFSRHLYGEAIDLKCAEMSILRDAVEGLAPGGIGHYPTFVHADVHGVSRRWGTRPD